MKNKYYADYSTFKNAVETFFIQFESKKEALKTLLNFKFGIIKANYYILFIGCVAIRLSTS